MMDTNTSNLSLSYLYTYGHVTLNLTLCYFVPALVNTDPIRLSGWNQNKLSVVLSIKSCMGFHVPGILTPWQHLLLCIKEEGLVDMDTSLTVVARTRQIFTPGLYTRYLRLNSRVSYSTMMGWGDVKITRAHALR